jgi:hypothetical protein
MMRTKPLLGIDGAESLSKEYRPPRRECNGSVGMRSLHRIF